MDLSPEEQNRYDMHQALVKYMNEHYHPSNSNQRVDEQEEKNWDVDTVPILSSIIPFHDGNNRPVLLSVFVYVDYDEQTKSNRYYVSDIGETQKHVQNLAEKLNKNFDEDAQSKMFNQVIKSMQNGVAIRNEGDDEDHAVLNVSSNLPNIINRTRKDNKTELSYRVVFDNLDELLDNFKIVGTAIKLTLDSASQQFADVK